MGTRDGSTSRAVPAEGGVGVFDALLVRQRIRPGRTGELRDALAAWASAVDDGDVRSLLPVDGVTLATLFLDRGAFGWRREGTTEADALVWYLEVVDDGVGAWADPDASIRGRSPLFETGLGELLAPGATVHADGRAGHQLVTHATHPRRQLLYADRCERSLVAPVAGHSLPLTVALTTVPLEPGAVSWLARRAVRVGNWFKQLDPVADRLRGRTDALEAERLYTESLLFEPVDDRVVLHYYMETEDMERLYEGYRESDTLEVRFADWAMRRVFVDPGQFLDPPLESDCEVLLHGVHPGRP